MGEFTVTPHRGRRCSTTRWSPTKFTVVWCSSIGRKPVPVTVKLPAAGDRAHVAESDVTVGLSVPIVELLMVMPLPQVPLGGEMQTPGFTDGLPAE